MAYQVSEEELGPAREEVIDLLARTRDEPRMERRFDWLYRENPDGPAVLWTIRKRETGELGGFTVALPRRVRVEGEERLCWNGADFSIAPRCRTLGLAMKLRRKAREGIDAGRASFLYSHPNERMQVIHEKVGHREVGTMVRYARVLRSREYLARRLPTIWMPALAAAFVDPLLRLGARSWRPWRHRSRWRVRLVEEIRFDERFDALDAEARTGRRVRGVRDARYLNWRWSENPLYRAAALLAEEGDRLGGYLLFVRGGSTIHVRDVFTREPEMVDDLISGLLRLGLREGAARLSAVLLEGNPVAERLLRFGFAPRSDTSRMFGYAREEDPIRERVLDGRSWYLTVGDRDV